MGDNFNLKIVIPLSLLIQAACYAGIAFTGFYGGEYTDVQLFVWFTIMGVVQSICFPVFISTVANWFSEKRRGLFVGGFCTCINVGNIIGA